MTILIGIDDTDNSETRGTGYQARTMASMLTGRGIAQVHGITRHQHFVHPDIPYTSHNSSACIVAQTGNPEEVWSACLGYLAAAAAPGSDAGLALAFPHQVGDILTDWAYSTKSEVVSMDRAYALARQSGIRLEGLTGNRQGIIGALASVALRQSGNDGRYIATGNNFHLRDLAAGTYTASELLSATQADLVADTGLREVPPGAVIHVGDYLRPVLRNQKCIILVAKSSNDHDWESAGKDIIGNY